MLEFLQKTKPVQRAFPAAVLLIILALGSAWAQELTIDPLINARSVNCLLEREGMILGGLDEGGLVIWDSMDPSQPTRILAGKELSGNQISDLAWTGQFVWVSTRDGGLTRIADLGGEMTFRQYSSNLGGINLTAVTGAVIGGGERVFYGMEDAGVGRIVDGLPGNLYTAEQDGLISNDINTLQFYQGDLFVGTPLGVSRFADNLFTDQNKGLADLVINDFTLDSDGELLAATNGGIYLWDDVDESWNYLGDIGGWAQKIVSGLAGTFALGVNGSGLNILSRFDDPVWTSVPLPYNRAYSLLSSKGLWVGGRIVEPGMANPIGYGWLGRQNGEGDFDTWRLDASLIRNAGGVTFAANGNPWIGSHNADGLSELTPEGWSSIYEIASAANDSSGLFNHGANVLSMATGADGIIYAGQYSQGVVRYDPEVEMSQLMYPANCGLEGGSIINMVAHPAGPMIIMHDWHDTEKVEVLTDTEHWRDLSKWMLLPTGEGGLGTGVTVWDAVVERNDVIWFAVAGTGLVRWDINGDQLGPDDPLTWLDQSDDRWDDPISSFSGAPNDPTLAEALVLAADGTIWAGGNGVVRFSYDPVSGTAQVEEHFGEKTSPFGEGLVNGNVTDLAVDGNGALWVATRSGINLGLTEEGETTFQAFFDLGNYLANPSNGALYSPNAIVSLPGGLYRKVVADPGSSRVLVGSDRGAVLMESAVAPIEPSGGSLSSAYLYPNPFKPDEGEGTLKLAGVDADALNGDAALVQIFNLDGQLVYENDFVSEEVGFWDGRNISIERNAVTTGMYLVKITFKNQVAVRPLAVLR